MAARAREGALRFVVAERWPPSWTGCSPGRVRAGAGRVRRYLAAALPEIAGAGRAPALPLPAGRLGFVAETIGGSPGAPGAGRCCWEAWAERRREPPENRARRRKAKAGRSTPGRGETGAAPLKVKRSFGTQVAALVRCCCMPLPTDETGVRRFLAHWGLATAPLADGSRAGLACGAWGGRRGAAQQGLERFEELAKEHAAGACLGPADGGEGKGAAGSGALPPWAEKWGAL